jgi:hypothetical protein
MTPTVDLVLFYSIESMSPSGRRPGHSIPAPHRIHSWDVKSGKLTRQINLKGGAPSSLAVSPDGKTLAALTADGGVSLRVRSEPFRLKAAVVAGLAEPALFSGSQLAGRVESACCLPHPPTASLPIRATRPGGPPCVASLPSLR